MSQGYFGMEHLVRNEFTTIVLQEYDPLPTPEHNALKMSTPSREK